MMKQFQSFSRLKTILFIISLISLFLIPSRIAFAQDNGGPTVITRSGREVPLEIACVIVVLALISAAWVYQDAQSRGGSACLWAIVVYFVMWPFSLIAYFIFRPKPKQSIPYYHDTYGRRPDE